MRLQLAVMCCLCALPAWAADSWLRLTSADFELYTAAGEKKGRATLQQFEQMRAFFLKASPLRKTSESPVRIIQFGSARQFERYSIRGSSPAYYLGTTARDYIVIGDPTLESSVATHEYMHLVIRRSGLKIPIWLNEGWADVYSTLRPMGRETAIGDLLGGRMTELNSKQWLDFDTLTSVDVRSPEYNEAGRIGIFYAESWALAHMLYLAPEYQDNFGRFVMALHQGKSAREAARAAWDKAPEKIMTDLQAYFGRKRLFGRAFELGLSKEQEEPVISALTEFDSRLALADLLAVTNRGAEAKKEYDALEREQPGRADLARSMGYLAGQSGDRETARKYFTIAFNGGETDPVMCMQLATLERASGRPPAVYIPMLERTLKLRPDYPDGQMQLGLALLDGRRFPEAAAALMSLETVSADRASAVYCGLGYARLQSGELDAAEMDADTCSKWANSDREKRSAASLHSLITARSKPEAGVRKGELISHLAGALTALDCSPTGKWITVSAANRQLRLALPEQEAVEFAPERGGKLQLACGAKSSLQVVVEYAPPAEAGISEGILRRLEY